MPAVSSVGLAVVFGLSFVKFLQLLLWVVFVDYIAVGMVVGTVLWFLANRYLKGPTMAQFVDQNVEWGYAFDVHCNAFFPLLLILHVLQLFLIKRKSRYSSRDVALASSCRFARTCVFFQRSSLG